ncbi:MAG: hypothetical protein IH591_02645, partial [Bacteroidales bacterium]|nr:hypothetical protein [Bacteroidales bacterium]
MSRTEHTDKEKSDILRYRSGDMTGEERHAFERKMQADPFLAGAEEGFSLITPGEAAADLEFLGRRLRTRTRRRSFVVYSGVAAALLLLLITSVIFLRTGSESLQESGLAMDAKQVSKDSIDNIALGSGVPEEDRMGADEKQTQTPSGTIKPTGTIKEAAEPAVVEPEKVARSDKKAVTGTVAETGKREEAEIRPDTAAMRRKADVAAGVPVTDVSVVPDMAAVSRMAMKAEPVAKA